MSNYTLSAEKELLFEAMVNKFLENDELNEVDFTGSGINFYTLGSVLEKIGYVKTEQDSNGWQMDLEIIYEKDNFPTLIIRGSALIFEIVLVKE